VIEKIAVELISVYSPQQSHTTCPSTNYLFHLRSY